MFFIVLVWISLAFSSSQNVYQYQQSFLGPFGGHIPFWETSGVAMINDNFIRLTSNRQSQRGAIWGTRPFRAKGWEIEVRIAIGSESRIGADGIAVWYTKERAQSGSVFGFTNRWNGLGIIVDTFDNDGKKDNPQIYGVYNKNNFTFDPLTDGKVNTLGICSAQVRQTTTGPHLKPIVLKISLKDSILRVFYFEYQSEKAIECFTAPLEIADMGSGYYFGVTAETGGLYDFHDVISFSTWSLRDITKKQKEAEEEPAKPDEEEGEEPVPEKVENMKRFGGPVDEVIDRISRLEKRDKAFTTDIESKFKEMQFKLESMEKQQIQTFSALSESIDNIRSAFDINKVEELKNDIKLALESINSISLNIVEVESDVETAQRSTADLHGFHDTRKVELAELVEKSNYWGFWTYFMIFQVLFWVSFLWWRKQKQKIKKFL